MSQEKYFEEAVAHFESLALKTPALVLLEGDLGMGKTTFVKELLSSWGYSSSKVQSPTFLKLLEHRVPGHGLCLHLDCYRIEDSDEFIKLGLEAYLEADYWFVEWPEMFLKHLAECPSLEKLLRFRSRIRVSFDMGENGKRSVRF